MNTAVQLAKKTTILFAPDLYDRLAMLARQRKTSVGELVREACEAQYFRSTPADRRAAVLELAELSLPVSTVRNMKLESVPAPEPLP